MIKIIGQLNIYNKDKVQVAIDRIRQFEPKEGYYLAFSGGKDSIVIAELCKMAGVKFEKQHNLTTVDPPELVRFIKQYHADTIINYPETSMWKLIVQKLMPPTRLVRYCCDVLKEGGGQGRFVITGVRWAESSRRKNTRKEVEFDAYGSQSKKAKENREIFLNSDNDTKRRMLESCIIKGKHVLNPIIGWTRMYGSLSMKIICHIVICMTKDIQGLAALAVLCRIKKPNLKNLNVILNIKKHT